MGVERGREREKRKGQREGGSERGESMITHMYACLWLKKDVCTRTQTGMYSHACTERKEHHHSRQLAHECIFARWRNWSYQSHEQTIVLVLEFRKEFVQFALHARGYGHFS